MDDQERARELSIRANDALAVIRHATGHSARLAALDWFLDLCEQAADLRRAIYEDDGERLATGIREGTIATLAPLTDIWRKMYPDKEQ